MDVLKDMLACAPAEALAARGQAGRTPLHAAVAAGRADAAALLLAAGARTDVRDEAGRGLREDAEARGVALPP